MFTTLLLPHLDELRGRSPLVESWHVAEGQLVRKGQALLVLSVDKATLEIQAAHGGTLRKRYVREGQRIAPGAALGVVGPATATTRQRCRRWRCGFRAKGRRQCHRVRGGARANCMCRCRR
jgi:pyruvate/2-oxoglutarate dehydrogenase complex dihydrolipoamide acyltransferase (E2) component